KPAPRKPSGFRGAKQKQSMPEFDYVVIDGGGKERRGQVRAETAGDARATLAAKKLFVVKLGEGRGGAAATSAGRGANLLAFTRNRLSGKELALFTRQLSTLAQVSPLEEALRTITRQ